jgi:hypothetical protein
MSKASLRGYAPNGGSFPFAETAVDRAGATHHETITAGRRAAIRPRSVAITREVEVQGGKWCTTIVTLLEPIIVVGVEGCLEPEGYQ